MFENLTRDDGAALISHGVFGICILVLIVTCPATVYLYYAEEAILVNHFVVIVHIVIPVQVSEIFELLIVLTIAQFIVCLCCASLVPPVMQVLEYVSMLTYWITSLRQLWYDMIHMEIVTYC